MMQNEWYIILLGYKYLLNKSAEKFELLYLQAGG